MVCEDSNLLVLKEMKSSGVTVAIQADASALLFLLSSVVLLFQAAILE